MQQIINEVQHGNSPQKVSKKDVYKKIDELFPMRMSLSEEYKFTEEDRRKGLFIIPRPWHYDEILEKIGEKITIIYEHDDDSYIFS